MPEHSQIAEVSNANDQEQLNTDSRKKVNKETKHFESIIAMDEIYHISNTVIYHISNV